MRRYLTVLLAASALAALAGCGSSDGIDRAQANRYADAVNKAQSDFAGTLDELSAKVTPTSTRAQDDKTLQSFQTAVDRVVGQLKAVDVPPRVKDLHAKFIAQISAYGREIDRVRPAFDSPDPQKILAAQQQLRTAVQKVSDQINGTINQINAKLKG
jgi:FKBP-type peptidyl-prolyl cis-trans isomerase (trigger factor)